MHVLSCYIFRADDSALATIMMLSHSSETNCLKLEVCRTRTLPRLSHSKSNSSLHLGDSSKLNDLVRLAPEFNIEVLERHISRVGSIGHGPLYPCLDEGSKFEPFSLIGRLISLSTGHQRISNFSTAGLEVATRWCATELEASLGL